MSADDVIDTSIHTYLVPILMSFDIQAFATLLDTVLWPE
jgi:hypothetical protein